jgi:ATP-dependent Lon protease
VTLRGNVLPVGGIKEKVLAARRAGVKRIILPERNKKDLVDVPEHNRKDLEFIFAHRVEDVFKAALVDMPVPLPPKPAEALPPPAEPPRPN